MNLFNLLLKVKTFCPLVIGQATERSEILLANKNQLLGQIQDGGARVRYASQDERV
jgi:hypothetical protein